MNKLKLTLFCLLTLFHGISLADSTDSEKPIQIFSDKFDGDDVKQIAIYSGKVSVHQGTLEIHGDKLTITIDPQGYRKAVVTPEKNKLVTFKQRKDQKNPKIEEWMHGRGDKLTYDEKSNLLILDGNAVVSRHENGVLKDQSKGKIIHYNLTTSTADMTGDKGKGSSGRVSTVIAPRDNGQQNSRSAKLEPKKSLKK